jgi:hypothetical protein
MATMTAGTTVLEVDAKELELIRRGLYALDTFGEIDSAEAATYRELRVLIAQGGA